MVKVSSFPESVFVEQDHEANPEQRAPRIANVIDRILFTVFTLSYYVNRIGLYCLETININII
jgi:hypothetical protein